MSFFLGSVKRLNHMKTDLLECGLDYIWPRS